MNNTWIKHIKKNKMLARKANSQFERELHLMFAEAWTKRAAEATSAPSDAELTQQQGEREARPPSIGL
jgi:hypothetical protein